MIARYTRPEMGRIWNDRNKFAHWLEVELAASEALAEIGEVPPEAARLLRQHAAFDPVKQPHPNIEYLRRDLERLIEAAKDEAPFGQCVVLARTRDRNRSAVPSAREAT